MAIVDATNTTSERRQWVVDELQDLVESKYNIIFIESVLTDPKIVEANVRSKLRSPGKCIHLIKNTCRSVPMSAYINTWH